MNAILKRLKNEPAFLGSVLIAVVSLAAAFGLQWDGEQVAQVTAFIALLTGAGVRSQVYTVQGARKMMEEAIEAQDPTPPEKSGGGTAINDDDVDRIDGDDDWV